jgi:DNA-binding Lrp family transcriptional regulator
MGYKYYAYTGKSRRPNPKEIGRKLGVDEKTVRLRTRKMENEGFIQYYQAIPNPCLFGRPLLFTYGFKAPSVLGKQKALGLLKNSDGIIEIAEFLGEMCGPSIVASSEEEAEMAIQKIGEQVGFPGMKFMPPRPFPPVKASPDKTDWEIMMLLRYDALRRTEEVAKELGITYRMVDYRISRLLDSQSLFIRAILNSKDPKGIVFYSLMLDLDTAESRLKQVILDSYVERTWWSLTPPGPMMVLNLFATTIGEPEDILMDATSRPGVRNASVAIFKGWVEPTRPNWIDRILEERAAA